MTPPQLVAYAAIGVASWTGLGLAVALALGQALKNRTPTEHTHSLMPEENR